MKMLQVTLILTRTKLITNYTYNSIINAVIIT